MKDIKISVIVPVYKVEKYLRKCVDSILAQSFADFEIILVDDGSPDNCGKICDEYALKDNRIKVIHKENGGLSDARNAGIKISKGEYLSFIDSDDYIAPDFLEILYKLVCENKANIAVCDAIVVKEDETAEFDILEKYELMDKNLALVEMVYDRKFSVNTWNKLYKKELFEEILFPKGLLYEDLATTYKLVDKSNKVVYTQAKLYAYVQRGGSIMGQTGYKMKKDKVEIVDEMTDYFAENSDKRLFAGIFNYLVSDVYKMASVGNLVSSKEYRKELKKWYEKNKSSIKTNQYISKKDKFILKLAVKHTKFLQFLYFRVRRKGNSK